MSATPPVVWIAGVGWDAVPGTDRRLVEALAERGPVIWVDTPARGHWRGWWRGSEPAVSHPVPGITRLRVPGLPGFSRSPIRALTAVVQRATVRRNLASNPSMVVIANPVIRFPRGVGGAKVLFVTDDWIAGAGLMGYSEAWLESVVSANVREADAVAAVTPSLLEKFVSLGSHRGVSAVIPNGSPQVPRVAGIARERVAGVVGQLNERLDLALLDAVADAGIPVRLIGPRTDSDPAFARRLDLLISRPEIDWIGPVAPADLPSHFAALGVGLTPYADSEFNRASFPLKTLEYLAAGLPVVSSDLPASRWLGDEHVTIAADASGFVDAVRSRLDAIDGGAEDPRIIDARIAFASSHSWSRRAESITALLAPAATV